MYQVVVRCKKAAAFGSRCSDPNLSGFWTTYDPAQEPPASFWKDYERFGWITLDGKHYCPQHNPDLIGEQVTISRDYVEVAPGVRVRWPGAHQQGDNMRIEVKVDPQPTERPLAAFHSPEAKQWKADVVQTLARRAAGLPEPDPDGVLRPSCEQMQAWVDGGQPVEPRSAVVNRDREG